MRTRTLACGVTVPRTHISLSSVFRFILATVWKRKALRLRVITLFAAGMLAYGWWPAYEGEGRSLKASLSGSSERSDPSRIVDHLVPIKNFTHSGSSLKCSLSLSFLPYCPLIGLPYTHCFCGSNFDTATYFSSYLTVALSLFISFLPFLHCTGRFI